MRRTFATLLVIAPLAASGGEFGGSLEARLATYPSTPLDPQQQKNAYSLVFNPEFSHQWETSSLSFSGYSQLSDDNSGRSHNDIRELEFITWGEQWELRAGIGELFWGSTESRHLVDVVNQRDGLALEGSKLGQPLVGLTLTHDWGNLDLLLLPGFRKGGFPDSGSRLRPALPVADALTTYEAEEGDDHIDGALHWSASLDTVDFGLTLFEGTQRQPRLTPQLAGGAPVLIPHYPLLTLYGLDLTWLNEDWIWKLEAVSRRVEGQTQRALTVGFEVAQYGLFDSSSDLGWLVEYSWDEGGKSNTLFDNDLMVGLRWSGNDSDSSEAMLGLMIDLENESKLLSLEASRRLTDDWKIGFSGKTVIDSSEGDPLLYGLRQDSYLEASLSYFF